MIQCHNPYCPYGGYHTSATTLRCIGPGECQIVDEPAWYIPYEPTYSQPTPRLMTHAEWSVDYHHKTVQKRQAELDQIYYDLHGYKGPFGYQGWLTEYTLNGTQYALDRLVQEFDPAKHISPLDYAASKLPTYEEKPRTPRRSLYKWTSETPVPSVIFALLLVIVVLIMAFV